MAAASSSTEAVSGAISSAVIARNFPASWVAESALKVLPQKVQSLLQRLGPLVGPPEISQGPSGLLAVARFQKSSDAQAAVQTLHGFDMRTPAEKEAANYAKPQESECFSLTLAPPDATPPAPAPAPTSAPAGAATAAGAAPAAGAAAPTAATRKKRYRTNGVILWPLPVTWGEKDVGMIVAPYGPILRLKVEMMTNGQKGALIDYQKDAAASAALSALNGMSLMGAQLRCVMQEEPEPAKPTMTYIMFMDELAMPSIPAEAEPKLDDREVFLSGLPRSAKSEEGARSLLSSFGEVDDVLLLRDPMQHKFIGKAYARFKSHTEAAKAIEAIRSANSPEFSVKASWSESARALLGTRGPYGLNVLGHICGDSGSKLQEIRKAAGAAHLSLEYGRSSSSRHVHFVARCSEPAQADECSRLLSESLARVHQTYSQEVHGSLVISGFPSSWSEKGLKFVFAPFGGVNSVLLEDEEKDAKPSLATGDVPPSGRIAYVKLRNAQAMEKAVTNLHRTKVGDGDLVDECVVACHRWHTSGWSDGTFRVSIFIDQCAMGRRPADVGPGPEDRELHVRNLPLNDMSRDQLQEYFEGFGEVDNLHLIVDAFTLEPTNEGYVRFKHHKDALRCIEALTPSDPEEADPTDLAGSWSESERVLQRKANCYKFNMIAEMVGADGSGLEKMKSEAHLRDLWLLGETLQLKDRSAPHPSGRQLHFIGRCAEEQHARLFRDLLEKSLEATHTKITDRLAKRKQKMVAGGDTAEATTSQGQAWQPPAAASFWGAPPGAAAYGSSYYGVPGHSGPGVGPAPAWGQASQTQQQQTSVFEKNGKDDNDEVRDKKRSRSRKHRKHRSEAGGDANGNAGGKERRHRSGSRKRRRRGDADN
eukprot:TRINITY_DN79764_c0_g1_i1.p1 TRINITY_DN79764_c0_g1~~TRINITY_DN79764_c0_g1_i1.p1  ORF type:complete len:876 (+),score=232.78 TRINITY_DN79764_c0_g1_i1:66-2693(+)